MCRTVCMRAAPDQSMKKPPTAGFVVNPDSAVSLSAPSLLQSRFSSRGESSHRRLAACRFARPSRRGGTVRGEDSRVREDERLDIN